MWKRKIKGEMDWNEKCKKIERNNNTFIKTRNNGWMNGWINERMNEWMDGWMDERMNDWMNQ